MAATNNPSRISPRAALPGPFEGLQPPNARQAAPGFLTPDVINLWLEDQSSAWTPSTRANREFVARQFAFQVPINLFGAGEIQAVKRSVEGKSRSWQEATKSMLVSFLRWCVEMGHLPMTPWRAGLWRLPKERQDTSGYRHYTHEEIDRLCAALEAPMVRFVVAACLLGWRKATLLALDWSMVSGDWILVPAKFVKQGVELRGFIAPRLRALVGLGGTGPLLPGLDYWGINRQLKAAARKVGLDAKTMRAHQMRRTWCFWFREAGGTRDQAMQIQRWASDNILISTYWPQVEANTQKALMEKM
jgi:integrase